MLSNLTIAKKLGAGFGVIILIICALVYVARHGFIQVDTSVRWNIHTYKVLDNSNRLLISLTNIETGMRGFALSGDDDFLEPYNNGKRDFSQAWTSLKELTSDNPTQQKRLDEIKALQSQWMGEDVEGTLGLRRAVIQGTASMEAVIQRIIQREDKVKMDGMRTLIANLSAEEEKLLGVRTAEMQSAKDTAIWTLIGGGVAAAAAALIIAVSLATSIRNRLNEAIKIACAIAEGRLETDIRNIGSDEVGNLLAAFSAMQQRLRTMILEIKDGARQLLDSAQTISGTSDQLAVAARNQSQSAASMAATVEELTVSINHVSTNATDAHSISSDSGKQSVEGGKIIQQTLESISRIASTVQNSAAQISELGRHTSQITSIVNVISEIAEQTNLLALNAAIEAARAGDQGRGFAVVADEVRLLAQRTGKSTQEIADMIQKIQTSTQEAVANMSVGVEQVNEGLELASSANQAIEQIRQGSDRIIRVVDQISTALREQSAASDDVARTVERIAQMAETNSQAIDAASRNAGDIKQLAQSLDSQVAQFRV